MYVINGILMLVTFFLCRVMLFPLLYLWYSTVLSLSLPATLASIPLWCHLATLGLWGPQLIWFTKIVKGSIKILKGRQKCLNVDPSPNFCPTDARKGAIVRDEGVKIKCD